MEKIATNPAVAVLPTTTGLAEIGSIVGDPGRANMLMALLEGRALTARELADRAGVAPQTASTHLARLIGCGLVGMEKQGRHRYHRLASHEVAQMLEAMHLAATALTPRGTRIRPGPDDESMRIARSCYDHLAGRVGVALADVLIDRGYISLGADKGQVSDAGAAFLGQWGIDLAEAERAKRSFCRPCIDWSERRPHLAGAVGAALLDRLFSLGWVRRRSGTRALAITAPGHAGFSKTFGIDAYSLTPAA